MRYKDDFKLCMELFGRRARVAMAGNFTPGISQLEKLKSLDGCCDEGNLYPISH